MKILKSLLIAFAIGFSISSNAADVVVGSVSCKEWVTDRTANSNFFNKNADQSWVIGFLGAYSEATRIPFLENVKTQSIYNWMDKYCASHPSEKINDGALALAHELIREMEKQHE